MPRFHCVSLRWLMMLAVFLLALASWAAESPRFDIPRLDGIAIDGDGGDWGARGFCVSRLYDGNAARPTPADFSATLRLGWRQDGVLMLLDVRDDVAIEHADLTKLWQCDSVELFLADRVGGAERYQLVISPGIDVQHSLLRSQLYDNRADAVLKQTPITPTLVSHPTGQGYRLEALLPWSALGITPASGREFAFQIHINDADDAFSRAQYRWFPQDGASYTSTAMQRLRLADKPSPALNVGATAVIERFRRIVVTVDATADLAGKTVRVQAGKRTLGRGTLTADAGRAVATLLLPLPQPGTPYPPLAVNVAGEPTLTLQAPDVDAARNDAVKNAPFVFHPFVFSSPAFPAGDFAEPALMENLLGRYSVKTTYYDAQYHPVTVAATPGRYGAIVEITGEHGESLRRFVTLYRQPEAVKWDEAKFATGIELPAEMGIAADVLREQHAMYADATKWLLADSLDRWDASAVLLAGLSEIAPGSGPATTRTDVWGRNDRWWYGLQRATNTVAHYPYAAYPPEGYQADTTKQWPVIIMLHGSGERGNDAQALGKRFEKSPLRTATNKDFIVVIPQCPDGEWWSAHRVSQLLDDVQAAYRVDADRVYLTGYSMGGYGTFSTATEYPERFAAVAPICGGGDPADAARLVTLPCWVFHGDSDPTVPFKQSQEMVDAITALGGPVTFTVYPGVGHDAWTPTFNNPELYRWFLQHRRNVK